MIPEGELTTDPSGFPAIVIVCPPLVLMVFMLLTMFESVMFMFILRMIRKRAYCLHCASLHHFICSDPFYRTWCARQNPSAHAHRKISTVRKASAPSAREMSMKNPPLKPKIDFGFRGKCHPYQNRILVI